MATMLTPKVLRRGLELSLLASLAGFAAVLLYRGNYRDFVESLGALEPWWIVLGLGLSSMDWIGGGLRHWVIARHIWPEARLRHMIMAGGMGAWAGYLTPVHAGASPMMVYTMRRYGVPIPVGLTTILMSFVTTLIFFAVAGPLAVFFGAGRSLGEMGNVLGLSLYDLFLGSLAIFGGLGLLLLLLILFPGLARDLIHRLASLLGRRSRRVATRLEALRAGIDQAHASLVAYGCPRGLGALLLGVLLTGVAYAPRLLAGYVALRAVGIEAQFVDVLLVQTLITFLLYFAPTPGASGIGEILSAVVMQVYVPRPLVALYTLLWRCFVTYATVISGSLVFTSWLRRGLRNLEQEEPLAISA
jgi:glycosyltransferase 2 family protein